MPSIFISHSSKDKTLSFNLAKELKLRGYDCFLDFQGIPGGAQWEQEIYAAMRQSVAVVVCATCDAMDSNWVFAEIIMARYSGIPVIPLLMENCTLPVNLNGTQYIDFTNDPEKGYRQLIDAIARINPIIGHPSWPLDKSPYPGLMPFRVEHAPVFFGRENELKNALDVLRPSGKQQQFLAFVGPSGSGKSSLLRAGLIPALMRGAIDNSEQWVYVPTFTPGETPFRNLAEKIFSINQKLGSVREIEHKVREQQGLLYTLLDTRGGDDKSVVLVIDQLEEIERRTPRAEADEFISQIYEAVNTPNSPIIVLSTLRADFFSACLQFSSLAKLLQNKIQIVGAMDRTSLRRAIVGPAQVAGLAFEDGLVEEILDDTKVGDALPLLAHVLHLLWDDVNRSNRQVVTRQMYENAGRVQDALALRAKQIYEEIHLSDHETLRMAFIELADVHESGYFTRRRVRLKSLSDIAQALLDRFVQARLLVTSQDDDGAPIIEVAHEALFRTWPLLSFWLESEREHLKLRRDIELAARDWERHNHSDAYLWRAERLGDAIQLMETETWDVNDPRRQFLITARQFSQNEQFDSQMLSLLSRITQAINAREDLPIILEVILDVVVSELNAKAGIIFLLESSTQQLVYAASKGLSSLLYKDNIKVSEDNPVGQATLQRQAITVEKDGDKTPSQYVVPLISKGEILGVLQVFFQDSLQSNQKLIKFLDSIAAQTAVAIDNTRLVEGLYQANVDLRIAYEGTVQGWARALELRDKDTEGHSDRVVELTMELAKALGINSQELEHVRLGAILHDIGKMGIPDSLLHKPGPFTAEEWVVVRQHPTFAYEMLRHIPFLYPALDIPYNHHERWDGSGYPRGLRGEEIPLAARIFSVVDVWDTLTTDRPYRKAWEFNKAMEYIRKSANSHFDHQVVNMFIQLMSAKFPYLRKD